MKPKFKVFISSDQHFNHANIIKYCSRPFKSLKEMNKSLIKRWNHVVRKQDIVIHLGDIIFTRGKSQNIKDIFKQLNGRIILVSGNHDRKSYSFYLSSGVDFICEKFSWYYNRKKIMFIHDYHKVIYSELRDNDYIIHGHAHEKGSFIHRNRGCVMIDVSAEKTGYKPLELVSVLNKVKKRKKRRRKR